MIYIESVMDSDKRFGESQAFFCLNGIYFNVMIVFCFLIFKSFNLLIHLRDED
jgi:hypothetical protein